MAKGHEPAMMTPATAYGEESSMPGRALVRKKTRKMHRKAKRRGGKRA